MNTKLALIVLVAGVAFPACAKKQRVTQLEDQLAVPAVAEPTTKVATTSSDEVDDVHSRLPIYFDYNSSDLRHESRSELARLGARLIRDETLALTIEGNTDERGSTAFNLALGERRARAARDYLVHLGVDQHRVDLISYGEERPAVDGENEDAWSANRRDEFVVSN